MKRRITVMAAGGMLTLMAFAGPVLASPSNQSGPSNGNSDFLGQGAKTADKAPASSPGGS